MTFDVLSPRHSADRSGKALEEAVAALGLSSRVMGDMRLYPGDVGEMLTEEGAALRRAGRDGQADGILDALIAHAPEPEDRQLAAVDRLARLRASGEARSRAEADRLLARLTAPSVLMPGAAGLLAEYLAEEGELETALLCHNVEVRKEFSRGFADPDEWNLMTAMSLTARANVRQRLGYPADEYDTAVVDHDPLKDLANRFHGLSQPGQRRGVQVLCVRADFEEARAKDILDGEHAAEGADAYYRAGERVLREQSREFPDVNWYLALFTLAEMREFARNRGGDPSDRGLRGAWGESLAAGDVRLAAWPPARNGSCWCGSDRKYKKCCGSAGNR